jgi:DNA repair protein RadA/Sms
MKLNIANDGIGFGKNIMDVRVPKKLRTRIKSGIKFVDDALGGEGFTPSAVTLFTGTPGAGKTTLMLKLADALTGKGTNVVFNTAEESLFQVKLVAERLKLKHGFRAGQEIHVPTLLAHCKKIIDAEPNKPFFLIVDSLQCLNDGKNGIHTNSRTAQRALAMITDFCKENFCNAIVIGQVNKTGQMAGSNVLKHMVDSMMTLSVEEKDIDLRGCRVLQMVKNRFGGAGGTFFLDLKRTGFREVARVSAV